MQAKYSIENITSASNHALVEVAESKAKLRKLRQQLEEKTEQLSECREAIISQTLCRVDYFRSGAVEKPWVSSNSHLTIFVHQFCQF